MSSAPKSRSSSSSKKTQKSAGSAGAQTFPPLSPGGTTGSNEMPGSTGSEEMPDTSGEIPGLTATTDPSRQTYPPQTPGGKSFSMSAGGGGSGGKSSRGPSTSRGPSGSKSMPPSNPETTPGGSVAPAESMNGMGSFGASPGTNRGPPSQPSNDGNFQEMPPQHTQPRQYQQQPMGQIPPTPMRFITGVYLTPVFGTCQTITPCFQSVGAPSEASYNTVGGNLNMSNAALQEAAQPSSMYIPLTSCPGSFAGESTTSIPSGCGGGAVDSSSCCSVVSAVATVCLPPPCCPPPCQPVCEPQPVQQECAPTPATVCETPVMEEVCEPEPEPVCETPQPQESCGSAPSVVSECCCPPPDICVETTAHAEENCGVLDVCSAAHIRVIPGGHTVGGPAAGSVAGSVGSQQSMATECGCTPAAVMPGVNFNCNQPQPVQQECAPTPEPTPVQEECAPTPEPTPVVQAQPVCQPVCCEPVRATACASLCGGVSKASSVVSGGGEPQQGMGDSSFATAGDVKSAPAQSTPSGSDANLGSGVSGGSHASGGSFAAGGGQFSGGDESSLVRLIIDRTRDVKIIRDEAGKVEKIVRRGERLKVLDLSGMGGGGMNSSVNDTTMHSAQSGMSDGASANATARSNGSVASASSQASLGGTKPSGMATSTPATSSPAVGTMGSGMGSMGATPGGTAVASATASVSGSNSSASSVASVTVGAGQQQCCDPCAPAPQAAQSCVQPSTYALECPSIVNTTAVSNVCTKHTMDPCGCVRTEILNTSTESMVNVIPITCQSTCNAPPPPTTCNAPAPPLDPCSSMNNMVAATSDSQPWVDVQETVNFHYHDSALDPCAVLRGPRTSLWSHSS